MPKLPIRVSGILGGIASIADQGFVALGNAWLVYISSQGGANGMAAFALLTATYFALLSMVRALLAEPFLAASMPVGRKQILATGSVGALLASLMGTAWTATILRDQFNLMLCGLAFFIVMLTEFFRLGQYSNLRSLVPPVGSFLGLVTMVAFWLFARLSGEVSPNMLVLCWICGSLVSFVVMFPKAEDRLPGRRARRTSLNLRGLLSGGAPLLLDAVGVTLVAHVCLFLTQSFGSSLDIAEIRAVTTMLSPLGLVLTALTLSLTPQMASAGDRDARRTIFRFSALIAVAIAVVSIISLVVGPWVIPKVFGSSVAPDTGLILTALVASALFASGAPFLSRARVQGTYPRVAVTRVVSGAVCVGLVMSRVIPNPAYSYLAAQVLQAFLILVVSVGLVARSSGRFKGQTGRSPLLRGSDAGDRQHSSG